MQRITIGTIQFDDWSPNSLTINKQPLMNMLYKLFSKYSDDSANYSNNWT